MQKNKAVLRAISKESTECSSLDCEDGRGSLPFKKNFFAS